MLKRVSLVIILLLAVHPAWGRSHPHHHAAHTADKAPAEPKPQPATDTSKSKQPPAPEAVDDPHKGSNTGLPLPRFAALKSDEVYMRVGPGTRYPIEWIYKRRGMPVEIIREFDVWRLVQDSDHVKGWMHQGTLTGRRGFLITSPQEVMRSSADEAAPAVAKLQQGVVGSLRHCDATSDWCQVKVQGIGGWLKRDQFWGIEPGEAVQ